MCLQLSSYLVYHAFIKKITFWLMSWNKYFMQVNCQKKKKKKKKEKNLDFNYNNTYNLKTTNQSYRLWRLTGGPGLMAHPKDMIFTIDYFLTSISFSCYYAMNIDIHVYKNIHRYHLFQKFIQSGTQHKTFFHSNLKMAKHHAKANDLGPWFDGSSE